MRGYLEASIPEYPHQVWHQRALDLLFPPVCVGCRRPGRWLCPRCLPLFPWRMEWFCTGCRSAIPPSGCHTCRLDVARPDGTGAVAQFEGSAREAVHALKYHERHAIASVLGSWMAALAEGVAADVVTHVPLHRSRRRERGYDQSALLARHAARTLGLPVVEALSRTRRTAQQALISDPEARRRNVAGAFRAERPWDGETVILVDDVATTGATIGAATQALREAGAGSVIGLVFARA